MTETLDQSEKSDKTGKFSTIFGTFATCLLALNTWQVSTIDSKIKQESNQRELNFRLYDSVAEAIDSGKAQRIQAVRVLVDSLASEELRAGFNAALSAGEVQSLRLKTIKHVRWHRLRWHCSVNK